MSTITRIDSSSSVTAAGWESLLSEASNAFLPVIQRYLPSGATIPASDQIVTSIKRFIPSNATTDPWLADLAAGKGLAAPAVKLYRNVTTGPTRTLFTKWGQRLAPVLSGNFTSLPGREVIPELITDAGTAANSLYNDLYS